MSWTLASSSVSVMSTESSSSTVAVPGSAVPWSSTGLTVTLTTPVAVPPCVVGGGVFEAGVAVVVGFGCVGGDAGDVVAHNGAVGGVADAGDVESAVDVVDVGE